MAMMIIIKPPELIHICTAPNHIQFNVLFFFSFINKFMIITALMGKEKATRE